jgi:hypothetical protein
MPSSRIPIYVWEAVVIAEHGPPEEDGSPAGKKKIVEYLNKHCKKWVFQLERGDATGFLHYQITLSLKKKQRRLPQLADLGYVKRYSQVGDIQGCFDYAQKADTRQAGPWSSEQERRFVPLHMRGVATLRNWQQAVLNKIEQVNSDPARVGRTVFTVIDEVGNMGKSWLADYMEMQNSLSKDWLVVTPVSAPDATRLLSYAANELRRRNHRENIGIIVDVPRYVTNLGMYLTAVEEMLNGRFICTKYGGVTWRTDRPTVVLLCNWKPDLRCMSRDRWCTLAHWDKDGAAIVDPTQ